MTRWAIVLLASVIAGAPAIWRASRVDSPIGVIVITLDTTRADRLTPYGLMDASMPALEQLAREGIVFDRASSVAPLTLPAHASLFTGLYPPAHGVADNNGTPLASDRVTLADILHARGFRTGAFVGSVVLNADRGIAQGFDTYRDIPVPVEGQERVVQRRADAVISDAIDWLDRVGESKFLLWAHLYDPHRPYDPPEPYRSRFADPYVAEIAFADAQIGRLFDHLRTRGLLDRTIVAVAGDHGESLGEHGERDHGIFVYESVLRVPLIVRAPRMEPARIGAVVRLVDVMPTMLDLLGIGAAGIDGVSLRSLMDGTTADLNLEVYAESMYPLRLGWSPLRSLREGRYKFIEAPRPELYDLDEDPFEQMNVYTGERQVADSMAARLHALVARQHPTASAHAAADVLTPEMTSRLGALGYVGTPPKDALPHRAGLPDPKDCLRRDVPNIFAATCVPRETQESEVISKVEAHRGNHQRPATTMTARDES